MVLRPIQWWNQNWITSLPMDCSVEPFQCLSIAHSPTSRFYLVQTKLTRNPNKKISSTFFYINLFYVYSFVYFIIGTMVFRSNISCKHPMTFGMIHCDFKPFYLCIPLTTFQFPCHIFILNNFNITLFGATQFANIICLSLVSLYLCARETPSQNSQNMHIQLVYFGPHKNQPLNTTNRNISNRTTHESKMNCLNNCILIYLYWSQREFSTISMHTALVERHTIEAHIIFVII